MTLLKNKFYLSAGVWLTLLSAIIYAGRNVVAKHVIDQGLNPVLFVIILNIAIGASMAAYSTATRTKLVMDRFLFWSLLALSLQLFLALSLHAYGLKILDLSLVTILLFTFPLFIAIIAGVLKHQLIHLRLALGLCIAFIGLFLTIGDYQLDLVLNGVLLMLFTAIMMAIRFICFGRLTQRYEVISLSSLSSMSVALVAVLALPFVGWQSEINLQTWLWVIITGILCAVANVSITVGIKKLGATPVGLIMNMEPVITILSAAFILNETLTVLQYFGGSLVLFAVLLASRARAKATTSKLPVLPEQP